MKICYIFRDPRNNGKSIEEIFIGLGNFLSNKKACQVEYYFYDNSTSVIRNIKRILSINADVFHVTGDVHFVVPFLFLKNVVLTVHDIEHFKKLWGIKKFIYALIWIILPIHFATVVTTVSKYSADELRKYFKFKKTKFIYNPVNPIFQACPKIFNKHNPTILQVGTKQNKNLEGVIRSITGLQCRFVIVGRLANKQIALLKEYKINYENRFDLTYEEVYECYKGCDLVTFVSAHEGFGMPVIEANAVGRPVITSNVCSLPEVANDAAVLISPDDTKLLRYYIEKIIHDDEFREGLIAKGFENIRRYSFVTIAQQYLDIYRKICD